MESIERLFGDKDNKKKGNEQIYLQIYLVVTFGWMCNPAVFEYKDL